MTASMHRRVRKAAERAKVRAWEYRQRNLAHGVWFRLRRVLAEAAEAYVLDAASMQVLLEAGCTAEPVGAELEPKKTIVFAPRERIVSLPHATSIAVRLSHELLAAHYLALVRFP